MVEDPRRYAAEFVLREGARAQIRAIRPEDRDRLLEHFQNLSRASVYKRFHCFKSRLSEAELRSFTELDFERHVGLVATVGRDGCEKILGVARYVVLDGAGPRRADVAVAVRDDVQGRGIATALLYHLLQIALGSGVRRFEADVLDDNEPILRMIRQSGLAFERSRAGNVEHLSLSVPGG
jgi:RimJ/RimL family protein N-acetyltransferase